MDEEGIVEDGKGQVRFRGDFPAQCFRYPDIGKVPDPNVVHVSQIIPVHHFEVTFVTAKAPDDRPIGSIDLGDGAEMEPIYDIIPLVVLLYAVNVTDAGQSPWRQKILSSMRLLVVELRNHQTSLAFWDMT